MNQIICIQKIKQELVLKCFETFNSISGLSSGLQ